MYGWWVGGCPLCCARRWWATKGLKWWWGRVGSRAKNTLQTVVQISYSSGQMLCSVVIHQVDWPRFQCLHKSADGQFQIGQKKKTGSIAGRQTHSSLAATAEQVHSTPLSSTGHWEYRMWNSLSALNLYGSPNQKRQRSFSLASTGLLHCSKSMGICGIRVILTDDWRRWALI